MAMVMDQQQQEGQQGGYKYYCRICKKGFGCGRALGGHMRAHGVNDDAAAGHGDNENDPSGGEWGDKLNPPPGSKRMYALRTNTNRLKSCRVCENCGKEFVSWKSFLEHGRCNSDDEAGGAGGGSLASSPRSEGEDDALGTRGCRGWSKGKRSRRAKGAAVAAGAIGVLHCPSSEEEDLANCLMMLSAARVDPIVVVAEAEESCASASKDEELRRQAMAPDPTIFLAVAAKAPAVTRGMFECKACKKVFSSHQALGGHRASHKKVKGCFAAKLEDRDVSVPPDDEVITQDNNQHNSSSNSEALAMAIVPFNNETLVVMPSKGKSKVHECSICRRVFASGQALGGHKRCHWITSNTPDPGTLEKLQLGGQPNSHHHQLQLRPMFECSEPPLDLNLPAPVDDLAGARQDIGSPLPLDMPASIYIHTWADHINNNNKNNATTSNNVNNDASNPTLDDEADSQVRLAKLSELKDSNMGANSSPWLQVGIGSSANERGEP